MQIVRQRAPNEPRIISNGDPIILAEGRIGAIVQLPVLVDEGNGYVEKTFEKFARPPGTRIIAVQNGKIYLQQEARLERNNVPDWRLPGGKVFDSFKEYKEYLSKVIPEQIILDAAAKELREEANLVGERLRVFTKKDCGATVEWDLFYVVAENVSMPSVAEVHNEGEDIRENQWFSFGEVLEKCKMGGISEGRTVAALLEFISAREE